MLTEVELKNLAINCYSCIKINGRKINYMSFIKQMENEDCNKAIVNIFKNIDLEKITEFIDNISNMSEIRKDFYKQLIVRRYKIIENIYRKVKTMY